MVTPLKFGILESKDLEIKILVGQILELKK